MAGGKGIERTKKKKFTVESAPRNPSQDPPPPHPASIEHPTPIRPRCPNHSRETRKIYYPVDEWIKEEKMNRVDEGSGCASASSSGSSSGGLGSGSRQKGKERKRMKSLLKQEK
ncbi:hypothetical protein H6P81_003084 [Aristolochia fimbriata]|uniref:Uncharacterized protein n=1 Tax=Aristolochia fimbriata TaxID=158543 RepID=A0AAV7FES5_ARIFI|nr:hypothetical protein H6P81_003084 [Aristolochia fimbriata]